MGLIGFWATNRQQELSHFEKTMPKQKKIGVPISNH